MKLVESHPKCPTNVIVAYNIYIYYRWRFHGLLFSDVPLGEMIQFGKYFSQKVAASLIAPLDVLPSFFFYIGNNHVFFVSGG